MMFQIIISVVYTLYRLFRAYLSALNDYERIKEAIANPQEHSNSPEEEDANEQN